MLWDAEILVVQHGAGLSNMVWTKLESLMIEIQSPLAPTIDSIFTHLAPASQLRHTIIRQDHEHAEISLESLAEIINAQSMGSTQLQVTKRPAQALRYRELGVRLWRV